MTLSERAHSIRTREDLVAFLQALSHDYVANRAAWDNVDLESFLDAMSAWAGDMEGYYKNREEDPAAVSPWRVLADILMGARVYE